MKLAELLQGPTPSPSPSPVSRAARGGALEGKPSDFAGALTEARKKPEPKAAEADAPAAKKPSSARKGKATKDDEQAPVEDTLAADEAVDTEESEPIAVDEAPLANDTAPKAEEDAEAPAETDEAAVDPNATLIAMAQATGPQLPTAVEVPIGTDVVEYTEADGQMICPPKLNQPAPTAVVEDEGESEALDGDPTVTAAEALLDGLDDVVGEQTEPLSDDIAFDADSSETPVAKALAKQAAAPVAPVDAAEPTESVAPRAKDATDAKAPQLSNEFAQRADAMGGEDAPVAASNIVGDPGGSSASTGHVQPEPAKPQATAQAPAAPAPAPPPPQAHFAEANHPKIVTAVQSQALTNGGTMQIRLDPPELGALQVMVHMQDGVMTASFRTSNDDATKLLSHSLSQLKQVLESQGVSVERLQVSQAPKDQHAQNDDPRQSPRDQQDDAHRQEQQRKEMLRRMWRRLSKGSDPLDLVA